jgi:hypothetical protein
MGWDWGGIAEAAVPALIGAGAAVIGADKAAGAAGESAAVSREELVFNKKRQEYLDSDQYWKDLTNQQNWLNVFNREGQQFNDKMVYQYKQLQDAREIAMARLNAESGRNAANLAVSQGNLDLAKQKWKYKVDTDRIQSQNLGLGFRMANGGPKPPAKYDR